MMRDLKLGFKIMKYGLGVKAIIFALVVCIIASVFISMLVPFGLGGLYLGMAVMMVTQLVFSVSVSTMVQTSPQKKRLQTTVPTLISGIFLLLCNTLNLLFAWLGYLRMQNNTNSFFIITMEPGELEAGIIFASGMMVFIMIYAHCSMKYIWVSTIVFLILFYTGFHYLRVGEIVYPIMPTWVAVLISYGIVVAGCVLMYGISCVTYKKDFSRQTFETQLKRAS